MQQRRGDNARTTFGSPPNLGGPKERPNFGPIFNNFRLWSQISPEWIDISSIWEKLDQPQPFPHWAKKTLVNFGPQTKKFCWLILTNQRGYFSGDYISAIRGCCALKFLNALQIDQGYQKHSQAGTGVPPKNFNRENLKLGLKFNVWASITFALVWVSPQKFSRRRAARQGW